MLLNEFTLDVNSVKAGEMQPLVVKPLKSYDAKISNFLLTHCSEYINIAKTAWPRKHLWHGWGSTPVQNMFVGKSVDYRQPRQVSLKGQTAFDNNLKQLGCTALRSNSLYCLSDHSVAQQFNNVHAIFPVNGFNFTWLDATIYNNFGILSSWWPIDYDGGLDFFEFSELGYSNKNFSSALQSKNELLIQGSFISLDLSEIKLRKITDQLLDD